MKGACREHQDGDSTTSVTVAASWATVVYAFGLRYFRMHSAGTPRTRLGLTAVRTHTFISFTFNALVVAMAVSLITGFIAAGS